MDLNSIFEEASEVEYSTIYYGGNHNMFVQIGNENVEFILEGINRDGEAIFMSKNIFGICSMKDLNKFLDRIERDMPQELLDAISPCEHFCYNPGNAEPKYGVTNSRKVWIPSHSNVTRKQPLDKNLGKDDMFFESFRDSMVVRLCGVAVPYWVDDDYSMLGDGMAFCIDSSGDLSSSYVELLEYYQICFSIKKEFVS